MPETKPEIDPKTGKPPEPPVVKTPKERLAEVEAEAAALRKEVEALKPPPKPEPTPEDKEWADW